MNKRLLCLSKNAKQIFYDPECSHAATHFADTLNLKDLVVEVLENRVIAPNSLELEVDMKRIIGTCDVVDICERDHVVYALRKNRRQQGYIPFVKSRQAQPSSWVSISLIAQTNGTYDLSSAWIGRWDDPPFPQEPHATVDSKIYWAKHAFVWGSQAIEPGTEVSVCPW